MKRRRAYDIDKPFFPKEISYGGRNEINHQEKKQVNNDNQPEYRPQFLFMNIVALYYCRPQPEFTQEFREPDYERGYRD